jgi:hypothetical protein
MCILEKRLYVKCWGDRIECQRVNQEFSENESSFLLKSEQNPRSEPIEFT